MCRCLSNAVLPIPTALSHYTLLDVDEAQEVAVIATDSTTTVVLDYSSTAPIEEDPFSDDEITVVERPMPSTSGSAQSNPPSTEQPSASHSSPDTKPIEFNLWIDVMLKYTWTLQQIIQFTEITEDTAFISAKLPNLQSLVEKFTNYDSFRALSPMAKRHSVSKELTKSIEAFIETSRREAPFPFASETSEPYLVGWLACAYTIESLEMLLRATNKPLKGQMSIRQTSCLRGLIRCCGLLSLCATKDIAAKLSVHLRSLLDTLFYSQEASVIEWDLFKMMVSLVFVTPAVLYVKTNECSVPSGNLLEFYLLKLMFSANLVKILLIHDEDAEESILAEDTEMMDSDSTDSILAFYRDYNLYAKEGSRMTRARLIEVIKRESQTFLRCSTMLFHFMTDIEMPDELESEAGCTFDTMCHYLGLGTDVDAYFTKGTSLFNFMRSLADNEFNTQFREDNAAQNATVSRAAVSNTLKLVVVPNITPISCLVNLPDDYSDLINSVCRFTCPNNDRDDTRNPTMCLVCGKILCSMTYCCQLEINSLVVGACTAHAMRCGAGGGIFLRIRECEVLLLGFAKGCFFPAPYLDEYGESDQGLRRGNALRLCKDRLHKLHIMWLSHRIHEDIARHSESNNSMVLTQWQNM